MCDKILTRLPKGVLKSKLYEINAETKDYPYMVLNCAGIILMFLISLNCKKKSFLGPVKIKWQS